MNIEREYTTCKTWAFQEFGVLTDKELLRVWITWRTARGIDIPKRKYTPEPLTLDDGTSIELNSNFAELENRDRDV